MSTILLVIHLLIALALIVVVLLQRSEGGGLGIGGGGGGGMSGFMTGRGAANVLTRVTAVLAACFMATSILLTLLAGGGGPQSIVDEIPESQPGAVESAPEAPTSEGSEGPVVPVE